MKARDERRDSGQYYPGGRVIARRDVAPQQVVVQWSDVQGKPQIAPLPERYRESDMKTKINEIASKFATVAVAALIGWSAVADVTVQKKRKDEIYNDELVVVDVTGGGGGFDTNAVIQIANSTISTNPIVMAKRDLGDISVWRPNFLASHIPASGTFVHFDGNEYYLLTKDGREAVRFGLIEDDGNLHIRRMDQILIPSVFSPPVSANPQNPELIDGEMSYVINYFAMRSELSAKADKSTTYTKSETDAKLAGKVDWEENRIDFIDNRWCFFGDDGYFEMGSGGYGLLYDDAFIDVQGGRSYISFENESCLKIGETNITVKANRPPLPVTPGNLASLTAAGDLADSGIAKNDVATRGMISAANQTFKGEVLKVAPTNNPSFTANRTQGLVVTDNVDGGSQIKLIPNLDGKGWAAVAVNNGSGWTEVRVPNSVGTVQMAYRNATSLNEMLEDSSTNQTARATTGTKVMEIIDQPVSQKINNSVTAALNTYIDGETGVEYVGKFYGGSLYYVPTGNVYPPNN